MAPLDATRPAEAAHTPRWGMVVDLNRCVGCQTCTAACKHQNATLPGVQWRQVHDVELGRFPDVERFFLVTGCQHCEEPPCVPVCPSGATYKRADGIVAMDYDLCIGCGYCAVACPYQARSIVHEPQPYYGESFWTVQEKAVLDPKRLGVAEKCNFCTSRIEDGIAQGLVPGVDLDATPACAAACIAQAIRFGDLADPESPVARLVRENDSFALNGDLGTEPSIRYLYETPAVPGRDAAAEDGAWREDPGHPLTGGLQRFWDLRAAMNFTLGGFGSGLALAACFGWLEGAVGDTALLAFYAAAALSMAGGLFSVFLEIGRQARFLNVLLRPQSSWMTREAYAVAVFYPALAADLVWPQPGLHLLVAAAAAVFLFCQARILHAGKGIPAWRAPLIPWMLAASGLFEGAAAVLAGLAFAGTPLAGGTALPALVAALAVANAVLWNAYRRTGAAEGIGPLARREIRRITPWLHVVGHAVPLACALLTLLGPAAHASIHDVLAGTAAVAGGVLWKITIVTRAAYQQGFELPKVPQRGSGRRAAPVRLGVPAR